MDPISAAIIGKALDGLSMRSMATAENIANANSASFRPARVTFEEALRAASAAGGADAVREVEPQLVRDPAVEGDAQVRLDLELATASATGLRYAALLDLLSRQIQIQRTAITGGQ